MKYKVVKDRNIREKFQNIELRVQVLKGLYYNMFLDVNCREYSREKLSKLKGIEYKIKNRCILTGRSKGVLRNFKISRLEFKKLAVKGLLIGVKKASW